MKEILRPTSVFGYLQKMDFRPVDGKLAPMNPKVDDIVCFAGKEDI